MDGKRFELLERTDYEDMRKYGLTDLIPMSIILILKMKDKIFGSKEKG